MTASSDLQRIIESAQRLGVEIDESEALQWLTHMAAEKGEEIVMDEDAGVFGHKVVMLDFNRAELERFRQIGKLVEFGDIPGKVETALALSGSAAQCKIQTYPGDADFFERVNIIADTREEACKTLAEIMMEKSLDTLKGETYQLIEVKLGSYPFDFNRSGELQKAGNPIAWKPADIEKGAIDGTKADGTPATLDWHEMAMDPGWCKLDWVFADPVRGQLANASNMLDVTWEAPDGSVTALDGYLDPYFQEVYLDAESVPIFSKLAKHVAGNAIDDYVEALEGQVKKYITKDINYGKAAKRMYNVFRMTGRYEDAAFLRELFDEPTTVLYQIWALIRTIDDVFAPGSTFDKPQLIAQADRLIILVVDALEGKEETEIVRLLLRLRDAISRIEIGKGLSTEAETARAEVINVVNNFFFEKLTGMPTIKAYMDEISHD